MSLEDFSKVSFPASSAVAVGQIRRHSSPRTEFIVEVQGPHPFEWTDPWRPRAIDRQGIVLRVVGESLLNWVDPVHESAPACILDLVVVPNALQLASHENWYVPAINCMYRIAIIGGQEGTMSDALWSRLPRVDIAVSASNSDVDAVAHCFVGIATGGGTISVDWSGVLEVVGCRGSQAACGRAVAVPGQGCEAGRAVQDALATLEKEVDIASIFLFQSISVDDTPSYDLWDMDVMATAAMGDRDRGKLLLTGAYDQQRTEVIVIAFDRRDLGSLKS